jgi:uncharacterized protein YdeI (YjbR/CyaY-like superfamily)
MITDIEDFFAQGCGRCARFATADCSARLWSAGLERLRALCLEAGLSEAVKWGHPCYRHAGRNIVIIGALREDFRLSFFNAALMSDPEGVLEKQGPNTRAPDMIRLRAADEVAAKAKIIRAYLAEAMGYAAAGLQAPRAAGEIDLPDELIDALDVDPELAEAFAALTPGRQRSYVIHLTSTTVAATRFARIAKCRDKIRAGKGFNER